MGTGVVIDARGYILTNYHVVDGVREIQVTMADGKRYVASLVARDMETDLAVIKINAAETLPVIAIGTSSDLMPGETVIAVGNAYGYEHTVTGGIVSALHRAVQVSDAQFYDDLIQTDAQHQSGQLGRAAAEHRRRDDRHQRGGAGRRAGHRLRHPGRQGHDRRRHAAGVGTAQCLGTGWWPLPTPPHRSGHGVAAVETKSPAAEAGLAAGDVVTAIDDTEIHRPLDFQRAMLDRKPGETLAADRAARRQAAERQPHAGRTRRNGSDRRLSPPGSCSAWN